ncbi:transposase [[Ruminococcus] gnavus]|uniref:IS1634 family transposase n=1 Tax=Mediterraneibacter gnavus TaxID=33038 RepID=UPI00228630C5|nr:transposase [Mediterraneibacter gnavus]MCZ0647012.1 transposase [Mediterraneibacter gnavus]
MYLDFKVKIPSDSAGITRKKIKGTTYIYYSYEHNYSSEKGYTIPKSTSIGKCTDDEPDLMYPNTNFLKFFPSEELPETKGGAHRSGCLRIGTYLVLRRIIAEYHLDEMIGNIIGKNSGLFLDLAVYSIIAENNAGQYYPDYAFNHPLFTDRMKIYSDSKVSAFINSITGDQSRAFLDEWNEKQDHSQKIYISYDSTNKNCQAGDIDFVEYGHPKEDTGAPVINYSVAYDRNNAKPLYYEDYPGSIVDVSQLQYMLEKAGGYGYKNVGFILDRGYFSKENIHYMDKYGYEFVIMMKGMKELVKSLVLEVKGTFEEDRRYSIRDYKVSGITVKKQLYPSDEKERYFHIFYNDRKRSSEHEAIEAKIDRMAECLHKHEGTKYEIKGSGFAKYFDLIYYNKGKKDEKFMYGRELCDVINEEIRLCGYFVIITSEKMTAAQALELYKSRDASEKLFRGDKSYLGNKSFRVHTSESVHAKIFIEFVALIIRSRFYTCLKEQMQKNGKKNYMTVPAAIRELEKIELIRQSDREYRMDYAVTATQKEILKAFNMTAANIRTQASVMNEDLMKIEKEG